MRIIGIDPGKTTGLALFENGELMGLTEIRFTTDHDPPKKITWWGNFDPGNWDGHENPYVVIESPWGAWARRGASNKALNTASLIKLGFFTGFICYEFICGAKEIRMIPPHIWMRAVTGMKRPTDHALWWVFELHMRDMGLWEQLKGIFLHGHGKYIQAREHIRDAFLLARYFERVKNIKDKEVKP